jgi:RecA/RadA recombinase
VLFNEGKKMAKKKVTDELTPTAAKPVEKTSFEDIDRIINKEFSDIIDLSKIDSKVKQFYDWGNYALNYISTKNLLGGVPHARVIGVEGLSGVGKSLLAASAMRDSKFDYVVLIESEGSGHSQELIEFAGVDPKKIRIIKGNTFTSYMVKKSNNAIEEINDDKLPVNKDTDKALFVEGITSKLRRFIYSIVFNKVKKNILIVLDSLANISSVRALSGTADMGKRGQDFNNFFKTFDQAFEQSNMTFIFTNKLYTKFDQWDPWASAGGVSPIYNSSLYLRIKESAESDDVSKGEVDEEKERRGTALGSSFKTLKITVKKSRFGTESRTISVLINMHSNGFVKTSGLFSLLSDFGIIKASGGAWYECPIFERNFMKKDFAELFMKNERENLAKLQKLLDDREKEIKESSKFVYANDIEDVKEIEAVEIGETPFGETDQDEIRKQLIRDVEK